MDKQSLCIDVLVNGYCQAYVDFFYLTHRPEPTGPEEKSEDAGIPPEKLPFVKSHLADAEAARRLQPWGLADPALDPWRSTAVHRAEVARVLRARRSRLLGGIGDAEQAPPRGTK